MTAFTLDDLHAASAIVHAVIPHTPQFEWPLLSAKLGFATVVKHENHTPVGAFKIRGGLVYVDHLVRSGERVSGLYSATRGNHGQSIALAGARHGLPVTIVVPHGNSTGKNDAMRSLGARLIEAGDDFQAAREHAQALCAADGGHMVPSFHPLLVAGVATGSAELLASGPPLDVVYVPIGMGSGACAMIAARQALGLKTEIVGVTSSHARAYALSYAAGHVIESPVTTLLADGMACRIPDADALAAMRAGLSRIVEVDDGEIAHAMRLMFECTHQVAEGAGAAALAAAWQERAQQSGRRVGLVHTGGNVDRAVFAQTLQGS
jgi:threonine dehydratase